MQFDKISAQAFNINAIVFQIIIVDVDVRDDVAWLYCHVYVENAQLKTSKHTNTYTHTPNEKDIEGGRTNSHIKYIP